MTCPSRYATLPCSMTGVGFTRTTLNASETQVKLHTGHGSQFPVLSPGEFFYAQMTDGCRACCEEVRVVQTAGDVFTIERPEQHCDCFSTNSRLRYTSRSIRAIRAIAGDVGVEVKWPLVYDCATRTISIDCGGLHEMMQNPCGESDANSNVSGGGA